MNGQIDVIGNESDVIDFNLNSQFSNIKKIIVTSESLFSFFEDVGVYEVFDKLSNSTPENYRSDLNEAIANGLLDSNLNSDLYRDLTEKITNLSDSMMDIKLDGYNFMNSVSNTKFNIAIRCESFSLTKYYEERGLFLSTIRALILDYLEYSGNIYRLSSLPKFQIEIYESEEVHKHLFLKKDGSSLILNSTFGFPIQGPIDYSVGGEFYFSKGEGFSFFRNTQTSANLREHNRITDTSIVTRDKILSDDELISVNNLTKHISDAVIELYITKKGKIKVLNLSNLENSITVGNENGFFINRSNKNYDKLSLISVRDNLDEELPNPKYLLLRNTSEIQNFLSNMQIVKSIDGIILTENMYIPLFDYIGSSNNIDIIFYKGELSKSLDIKFDAEQILIGDKDEQTNLSKNPFSNIIEEKNAERDEHLERLKKIDLSTPKDITPNEEMDQVNNIAEQLISSPNSSIHSQSKQTSSYASTPSNGKPLSAFDMLANAALNRPEDNVQPAVQEVAAQVAVTQAVTQAPVAAPVEKIPSGPMSALDMLANSALNRPEPQVQPAAPVYEEPQVQPAPPVYEEPQVQPAAPVYEEPQVQPAAPVYEEPQVQPAPPVYEEPQVQPQYSQTAPQHIESINQVVEIETVDEIAQDLLNNERTVEEMRAQNLIPQTQNESIPQDLFKESESFEQVQASVPEIDVERYNDIITTKIVTLPNVESDAYFVDSSNIGEITTQGDLFFLTPTIENLSNPNLNYVVPMGLTKDYDENHYYIINSTNDYFLFDEETKINTFINLSYVDDSIKKSYIERCLNHSKNAFIVLMKEDIDLVEDYINKIEGVFIKNVETSEELSLIKNRVLGFEKKFLLRNF